MRQCEKVSWALMGNVSLMKVCLYGGRATTVLPTAQPIPAFLLEITAHAFENSQIFPYRSESSESRTCIAKAYGVSVLGRLLSVCGKWAMLQADILEKTAECRIYLNLSRAKVH